MDNLCTQKRYLIDDMRERQAEIRDIPREGLFIMRCGTTEKRVDSANYALVSNTFLGKF